jgi:dTDP-4-dehydrorhamnose 3,5-epimerase/reductase
MSGICIEESPIPGLFVVRLDVRRDERGWFQESWQREKFLEAWHRETLTPSALPDFQPVQANVAWNTRAGTTRGLHAEPWDKLVTVVSGRAFSAWVDLREGDSFGRTFSLEIEPGVAVFIPRGVANGYQTLTDGTSYAYLVNDHWRPDLLYLAVDVDDPELGIAWPMSADLRVISDKDRTNPRLAEITPVPRRPALVLGADGQVGRALVAALPWVRGVTRRQLDITDPEQLDQWPWRDHDVVVNAAAYTAVDAAETEDGRRAAWSANALAPAALAKLAARYGFTLVHYSTDYVYDGTHEVYDEDDTLAPLGVYGQSKAAGDVAVTLAPRHYLIRSSWVVGEGKNFVRTMVGLADSGVSPAVVGDQVGRLTFADEIARATRHLLDSRAPYGSYNVTNGGPAMSWADVAREVFSLRERDPGDVKEITTEQYAAGKALAPRPRSSVLSLARLEATGFTPHDAREQLRAYVATSVRP